MNTTVKIDSFHKALLSLILQNKYVRNNILMGDKLAGEIEIHDDGSVRIYTKQRKFKWLCVIFGDFVDKSFRDLALTLIDVIAGPDNSSNKRNFDGMTREFMKNAVRKLNYEYVIDMLFDVLRVGVRDGEYTSKYLADPEDEQYQKERSSRVGTFSRMRGYALLNSGEPLGDVELFIKRP